MANNSNKKLVPEAMSALDKFKYEVASDMCVKNIFKHYLLATFFVSIFLISLPHAVTQGCNSYFFMLFSFLIFSFHLIH